MLEAHVLAIVVIGVSCFIVGSIPIKFSQWPQQPFFLSLLLCCGGGVLLATSIVHMLAEVHHQMPNYAELVFCAGFLLLYACDEFLHLCVQDQHSASEHHSEKSVIGSRRDSSSSDDIVKVPAICHLHRTSYGTIDKLPKRTRFYSLSQSFQPTVSHVDFSQPSSSVADQSETTHQHHCCRSHERERSFQKLLDKSEAGCDRGEKIKLSSSESSEWSHNGEGQCHIEVQQPCPKQSNSSVSGLLAALLIHSLLEGCSIGVQTDSTEVLLILGAVASHKLVLSFCLGMELASAGHEGLKFILAITAFSVGCPLGIGIGAALNTSIDGVFLVEAPLQAVAAGSLLYVAVFEVLPREKFKWQHRTDKRFATFFQMISVMLGFTFIVLLSVFFQEVHTH